MSGPEFFDTFPIACLLFDAQGVVTTANPVAFGVLKRRTDELVGRRLGDLVAGADQEALETLIKNLEPGQTSAFELNFNLPGDQNLAVRVHVWTCRSADPKSFALLMQPHDSEVLRLEGQDRDAAVPTLAAGVAHEFNNILGTILACAEDAMEESQDASVKRSLRLIVEKVDQASAITDRLLSFAEQQRLLLRTTHLELILDQTVQLLADRLEAAHISVVRRYAEVPQVRVDRLRMQRVFLNLLTNALEAMPEGGVLTLTVELRHDRVLIQISDTGTGIPPQLVSRVFEPFVTTKGLLGGGNAQALGLGLSVARGIIRAHGGSIGLQSEPGKGTNVSVILPFKPPHATEKTG